MVKKLSSLVLVLSIICITANTSHSASYWARTYNGGGIEYANSIQEIDGGYIVVGHTWSFSVDGWDIWVLKLDSNGNVTWQKTYGGTNDDSGYSIQQTIDGGYIVVGHTDSFGAGEKDIWVLKLGTNGDVTWQKTYGGNNPDVASSIQQTSDGGYIIAGQTVSFGAGLGDLWVLKLGSNGNVTWQKTYGDIENEGGNSIQQTTDGGYIISGSTDSFSAVNYDFWVLKIDSNGDVTWQKTYGGSDLDYAYSIQQTFNQDEEPDGYIVAGTTVSFGVGYGYNVWILKLDNNGEVSWQKTYGGSAFDQAWSIHQTSDRGYIVTGHTGSFGAGEKDIWVLKLGTNGDITWQKTYGGSGYERASFIQQTTDGGYIVAGIIDPLGSGGWYDIEVLKLDSNGEMSDCDIIGSSDAIVSNTIISGQNSSASISSPSATITNTNVLPQDSSGTIFTVCPWIDSDGDGVPDGMPSDISCAGGLAENCADNCSEIHNTDQSDTDGDGVGDVCDNCPNDSENDIDGDSVCGDVDNCPNDYNLNQIDTDLDNIGDVCDNCPDDYNPNQEDTDGDGVGDVCEIVPTTSSSTTTSSIPQPPPNTTTSVETTTSSSTSTSSATTTEPTTTIPISEDCMLHISVSPPEGGTTSPPPPQYFVMGCQPVTVEAIPNPRFKFSHWEGDAQGSDNPITIETVGTLSITAVFVIDLCTLEQIYGEQSEETELLRDFRDNVLNQTPEGQELIRLYYQWSPSIVKAMERDEDFKEEIREMIDEILPMIRGGVE